MSQETLHQKEASVVILLSRCGNHFKLEKKLQQVRYEQMEKQH